MLDETNDGAGIWTLRRRFMYITTLFCMGVVAYCLHYNMTSVTAQTAVSWAFITIASTVGSYVFGAAWDDHSARQFGHRGRRDRVRDPLDTLLPGTPEGRGNDPD